MAGLRKRYLIPGWKKFGIPKIFGFGSRKNLTPKPAMVSKPRTFKNKNLNNNFAKIDIYSINPDKLMKSRRVTTVSRMKMKDRRCSFTTKWRKNAVWAVNRAKVFHPGSFIRLLRCRLTPKTQKTKMCSFGPGLKIYKDQNIWPPQWRLFYDAFDNFEAKSQAPLSNRIN